MSLCPVCGSDDLTLPPEVRFRLAGLNADICKNCGIMYYPEISKNYKKGDSNGICTNRTIG